MAMLLAMAIGSSVCRRASASDSQILYDIDFSAPEHVIGSTPTVGNGPKYIGWIEFGAPTVQATSGVLINRPVEFDAVSSYEQFGLTIDTVAPDYRVDFDVATHQLRNSKYAFSVILDTPEVRTVDFNGIVDSLSVYEPFASGGGSGVSFLDDQIYHVTIFINIAQNSWQVYRDGALIYTYAFNAKELDSIRFDISPAYAGASDAPGTSVAVDNIRVITEQGPDPSLQPADQIAPKILVKGPALRHVHGHSVTINGTASDDQAVQWIEVRTGSGPFVHVRGDTVRWRKVLALKPGRNIFFVRAIDAARNVSKTMRIVVIRDPS